jgi:hypothetical protein
VVFDVSLGVCHASWFSPEDKEFLIYLALHSVVNDDFRRFNQKGRQNNRLRLYREVMTETKAEGENKPLGYSRRVEGAKLAVKGDIDNLRECGRAKNLTSIRQPNQGSLTQPEIVSAGLQEQPVFATSQISDEGSRIRCSPTLISSSW